MTEAAKTEETQGLDVRPDPDGVIRLRAVARATLELALDGTPALLKDKALLRVTLKGRSTGLPDATACQITCRAPNPGAPPKDARPRESSHPGTLRVPGWKAGAKDLECSVAVDLPIVTAALFDKGTFDLAVLPGLPHAPEAVVAKIPFDHPFTMTVGGLAAPTSKVGERLTFTPKISAAAFAGCPVRVRINEHDKRESGVNAEDLSVELSWQAGGGGGAKVWRVGCDAAGHLDYAERDEADPEYDFWWVTQAAQGAKGAWVDVRPPTSLCKTPRPALTRLVLERDAARVRVVGAIAPVAADLHARVRARLWCHRPFGSGGKLRLMSPLPFGGDGFLDDAGAFEVDLAPLGPLAEGARSTLTAPGVELFGVLQLVGWSSKALPLSAAVTYDPVKNRPFGDDDLPRLLPRQRAVDVAVAVCTEGVAGVDLVYQPDLLSIEARLEGEQVVVRSHLAGGDAAYWRDARVRLEGQAADDPKWVDLGGKVTADGAWLEARLPMSDKRLVGKEVAFRATVTEAKARLRGAEVQAPDPVVTPARLVCKPAILGVSAGPGAAPGTVEVEATTRYCPRVPSKQTLAVELFEATADAKEPRKVLGAAVKYANPTNKQGVCDAEGRLVATLSGLSADATAARARGALQVRVFGSPLGVALSEAAPVRAGP